MRRSGLRDIRIVERQAAFDLSHLVWQACRLDCRCLIIDSIETRFAIANHRLPIIPPCNTNKSTNC